jgi:hypothetical protein
VIIRINKLNEILEERRELRKALNIRISSDRLRIEENELLLLKTILDTAMYDSVTHDKRQSDIYRSVKSIDQLAERLKADGFEISGGGFSFVFYESTARL